MKWESIHLRAYKTKTQLFEILQTGKLLALNSDQRKESLFKKIKGILKTDNTKLEINKLMP